MKRSDVYVAYAQSLVWITLLIALVVGISSIVELVFVDFIHGNPHRTKANAMLMMVLDSPIMGFIAVIGSLLVFTLPQGFQAVVSDVLVRRLGRRGQFGILLALPITATLAWYCYDYLTPSDVHFVTTNEGPDWMPYQHGLSLQRYLTMLIV